jgi:hypothetical protein
MDCHLRVRVISNIIVMVFGMIHGRRRSPKIGEPTMQPTRNTRSKNIRTQSVEFSGNHLAPTRWGVDGHVSLAGLKASPPMNRKLFLLSFVAAIAAWSPTSFAQRQTAVGPGTTALLPTGVANGVDMSVSGTTGTLSVGVTGGPEMDIFTNNISLASPFLAVPPRPPARAISSSIAARMCTEPSA